MFPKPTLSLRLLHDGRLAEQQSVAHHTSYPSCPHDQEWDCRAPYQLATAERADIAWYTLRVHKLLLLCPLHHLPVNSPDEDEVTFVMTRREKRSGCCGCLIPVASGGKIKTSHIAFVFLPQTTFFPPHLCEFIIIYTIVAGKMT